MLNIDEREGYEIRSIYNKDKLISTCKLIIVNLITLTKLILKSKYYEIFSINNKITFEIKLYGIKEIKINKQTKFVNHIIDTNNNITKNPFNFENNLINKESLDDNIKTNKSQNKKEEIINTNILNPKKDNNYKKDQYDKMEIEEAEIYDKEKDKEKDKETNVIKEEIKNIENKSEEKAKMKTEMKEEPKNP